VSVLIRRATESDVRAVARLQHRWAGEGGVYGFVPESLEQLSAALGPYLLVAEVNKEIAGFVSGSAHVSEGTAIMPRGTSYLEIDNLYIVPEHRRRGIGGELIARLLAEAKGRGVTHALLYSAAKDVHGVLRFYERHDFRSWYVQMFRQL
jgi:ribosomal protein S18 acetylase RimI-like enzyme